jgi:hypothetical protein
MAITTINLSSLDGSNGFRLDGVAANDQSGRSVSNAGDVNGDGYDDVIVGAPFTDPDGVYSDSGSSYLVFGKASGFDASINLSRLNGTNGFRLDGRVAGDNSGISVSSAGDINGDGFDDLIVGAADGNGNGSSYVVFGKIAGFDATLNLSSLDGSNGFRLDGPGHFGAFGYSVSDAGDVNGDGFDDVIIGDPQAEPYGYYYNGSSFVVLGKASGFDATLDLSSLDGSNGFRLNGAGAFGLSGTSVSGAGDVNGDGFDDVIIGAFYGHSYVVFGKAAGFDATTSLFELDGSNGFRLNGGGDNSGVSVSSAGDVNGDGFDDLIVGVPEADSNGENSGSSYVVFGKADGFAANVNLSSLDGSNGFRLDGAATYDYSGHSVSSAGDVNGDGFDDFIVGTGGRNVDSSFVVFGRNSGFSAAIDLSNLDSNDGFRLDAPVFLNSLGHSVSGAGDLNGDGFSDVIVGGNSSYVVFGRSSFTDEEVIQGTPKNDKLTGTAAAEHFKAGPGNDSMIGNGGADVFEGGAGNDYIRVSGLGFESIDGGAGRDILGLGGSGLDLNLTDMGDKISGIETIYLYGNGDNTLTLTAADVLNLSDTSNTLKVNGNSGDRIVGLSHGWKDGGIHGGFHTYTNNGAVLLVGTNVATDDIDVIQGTPKNDKLTGTAAAEHFKAGPGNDSMIGNGGADVFEGGAGNDYIRVSGLGFESIDGGAGRDILGLGGSGLNLNLTDMGDKISGIETIYLYGSGDNTLTLTAADVRNLSNTSNTLKVNGNAGDQIAVLDDGWKDGGIHSGFHTYTNDGAVLLVGVNVATDFG